MREHPGDPSLLARMAEAQLAGSDTDAAENSARAALAIDPHQNSALHTLSAIALNNRDYESAIPWLRELAAQDPHDLAIQLQLSRALAQTGHPNEALPMLQSSTPSGLPRQQRRYPYTARFRIAQTGPGPGGGQGRSRGEAPFDDESTGCTATHIGAGSKQNFNSSFWAK